MADFYYNNAVLGPGTKQEKARDCAVGETLVEIHGRSCSYV
jgi:hypothetical protein